MTVPSEPPAVDVGNGITFRPHRPGDMGYLVHRHGLLYARDLNIHDERFEATVAQIAADFLASNDPARERVWIAERKKDDAAGDDQPQFIGCIALMHDKEASALSGGVYTAKLRLYLVEPSARGTGVGRKLLRACVEFARGAGYERISLRTESVLVPARKLYAQEGFVLTETFDKKTEFFAEDSRGEKWELEL